MVMSGCLGQKVPGEGEGGREPPGKRYEEAFWGDGVTPHRPHFRRGSMDIYNCCNSMN